MNRLKKPPTKTKNIFNKCFNIIPSIIGATIISAPIIISNYKLQPETIFKQISPSIVTVISYGVHKDPFSPNNITEYIKSTGTGFSFGGKDYIVTNNHVINDAFNIKISTQDNEELTASIVGNDIKHDIALLHIDVDTSKKRKSLPNLKKCTKPVNIGQASLAIGNPFGLDRSMTSGIISGIDRTLDSDDKPPLFNLLQTDTAINPGNSGGPLLDASSGCVLGVNTAIISPTGTNSGVGFAIPINRVDKIVNKIIKDDGLKEFQLGITLLPSTINEILGINGVIIAEIIPDGNAEKIGLIGTHRDTYGRPIIGDIIIGINNKVIKKSSDLYGILDNLYDNILDKNIIKLKVLRVNGIEVFDIKI